jgi:hypothetical protein
VWPLHSVAGPLVQANVWIYWCGDLLSLGVFPWLDICKMALLGLAHLPGKEAVHRPRHWGPENRMVAESMVTMAFSSWAFVRTYLHLEQAEFWDLSPCSSAESKAKADSGQESCPYHHSTCRKHPALSPQACPSGFTPGSVTLL